MGHGGAGRRPVPVPSVTRTQQVVAASSAHQSRVGPAPRVPCLFLPRSVPNPESLGGVATVDWEGDADDEAGAGAAEPEHRGGDLVDATETSDGLVAKRLGHVQI